MAKKKAPSGSFGTSFKCQMGKLLAFVGAIWHRLSDAFREGFKYGRERQNQETTKTKIEDADKTIQANKELIESLEALRQQTKQRTEEIYKTGEHHNTPDPLEPVCEMDFFIGGNRPVRVQMSYAYWCSLQDSHPKGWNNILKFVDDEIERRKDEDE